MSLVIVPLRHAFDDPEGSTSRGRMQDRRGRRDRRRGVGRVSGKWNERCARAPGDRVAGVDGGVGWAWGHAAGGAVCALGSVVVRWCSGALVSPCGRVAMRWSSDVLVVGDAVMR